MPTILVTGANRGLGLEFCRQYAQAGWRVLACCRNTKEAIALHTLAANQAEFDVYPLDVTNHEQIDSLSCQLADETIDILLNDAGV